MAHHTAKHTQEKSRIQVFADWLVPVGVVLLYYALYNYGKISLSEAIKTTGLAAIALLSITLAIGPLARFIPIVDRLKAHRKAWGIASFYFFVLHFVLVFVFYFKLDAAKLFNPTGPRFLGLIAGILAGAILLIISLISIKRIGEKLDPKIWKYIQTTSYLALIFAVAHFYLMEQEEGVLSIKRLLGRITFWFALVVVIFRFIVLLLPKKNSQS